METPQGPGGPRGGKGGRAGARPRSKERAGADTERKRTGGVKRHPAGVEVTTPPGGISFCRERRSAEKRSSSDLEAETGERRERIEEGRERRGEGERAPYGRKEERERVFGPIPWFMRERELEKPRRTRDGRCSRPLTRCRSRLLRWGGFPSYFRRGPYLSGEGRS